MAPKFSEEELSLLTEEERLGLLEEEEDDEGDAGDADDDDNAAGGNNIAGGDSDDGDADAVDEATVAAAAAAAAATAAPEAAAATAAAAAAAAGDGATTVLDPGADVGGTVIEHDPNERAPAWMAASDNDAKLKAIDDQRDEIAKKFDDGDLTAEEMRAQLKPLDSEYRTLERAEIKREVAREAAVEGWMENVGGFLDANPQYKSGAFNALLDTEVKRLQSEAVNPFNPKILERAHANIAKQVKDAFGIEAPAGKTTDKKQDAAAAAAAAKPAPKPRPDMPPNLGAIPAADITDADDGGEFAHLDRLAAKDSVAFERELGKLSPEAQNRYLAQ